jgi:hypothetical protein
MEESFKVPEFPLKPAKEDETPEETKVSATPEIPYKVPKWSGPLAAQTYSFEVLKNGVIVDVVKDLQSKPFWMFGRLPLGTGVDIQSLHPTTSRFHAVLQYKESDAEQDSEKEVESGWFIHDLGKL